MNILLYAGKLTLIAGLLYGYYHLLLKNRPCHRFNRAFILLSGIASLLIPLIHLPLSLAPAAGSDPSLLNTLHTLSPGPWADTDASPDRFPVPSSPAFILPLLLLLTYAGGVLTGLVILLRSWLSIRAIKKSSDYIIMEKVRLYQTAAPGTPFSFFRHIFWNPAITPDSPAGRQILQHELSHIRNGHSADVMYFELLCTFAWFCPFFHLLKKEMKAIHEFQADQSAAQGQDKLEYAELLLRHAILRKNSLLNQSFARQEMPRRLRMILHPNAGTPLNRRLGGLLLTPILLILLCACSIQSSTIPPVGNTLASGQALTVVIDAGHGGIDAGAENEAGIKEKDIVLSIAEKVRELAAHYPVNIIMTRTSDQLPGNASSIAEGLRQRVEIAKENNADLFISLHVNNSGNNTPPGGIDAYISGKTPAKGSLALANTLLERLSSTYAVSTAVKQRSDAGIHVLDFSPCPAVLLELGYINLPQDLQFFQSDQHQDMIARDILDAIVLYDPTKQ